MTSEYDAREISIINVGVGSEVVETKRCKLNSSNIPVWILYNNGKFEAVNREDCNYVLAHVSYTNNLKVGGIGRHQIGEGSMMALAVPCEDFWLYYIEIDYDVVNLSSHVKRGMSVAYSGIDQFDYSDGVGFRYLRRVFAVDKRRLAHRRDVLKPRPGEFPMSKVSAEHHTHYRPEEIWHLIEKHKHLTRAAGVILHSLRKIKGITEAAVSGFLAYLLFCEPQIAYLLASSTRLWHNCETIDQLGETLKQLVVPLKSLQRYDILDLSQLFELQVLLNRGIGSIDWDKERGNRERPDVVDVDPVAVYHEARKVFEMGKKHGYKYSKINAEKYVKARWEWVPTGSVHSQYAEDKPYIKKEYRHRTKFVALNMMSKDKVREMFQRPAELHAWASVKYEWAKMRAIYGVDLTSSVVTNYAFFRCEEALRHRFPVGEEAQADRVHKRLGEMLADAESFCFDFDDFNAQHSKGSMQAVLMAYLDCFRDDMDVEQAEAAEWVINSIDNMVVHNNEEKRNEVYRPAGTLLSGWRLTTFVNSVLNFVYFSLSGALDSSGVVDSVHNGDDVLLSVRNLKAVLEISKKMKDINARAQPLKCNAFSIGEFLRVEHRVDKDEGIGAQYLARSIATLVHSRTESQEPLRLIEAVKAHVTRVSETAQRCRRGAEVLAEMLDMSLKRLAKIFGVEENKLRRLVQAHTLVGGPITDESGKIDEKFEEEVQYIEPDVEIAREKGLATVNDLAPGISDYAEVLERQYEDYITVDQARNSIKRATKRQLAITRGTKLIVTDIRLEQRWRYGRALYGMYRRIVDMPYLEKAKFANIPPIALLNEKSVKFIRKLINEVSDVEYALKVYL